MRLYDTENVQIADIGQQPQGYSRAQDLILRLEESVTPLVGEARPVLLHPSREFLSVPAASSAPL
jgi:hypothetical protein